MEKLTYNEIINKHGEEIGLAYENLVISMISGMDTRIEMLVLADACENLKITQELINRARIHAQQEIDEAAATDADHSNKTKKCTKCGKSHSLENFSKNNRNKDGLDRWCKGCIKAHHNIKRDTKKPVVVANRIFPIFN